MRKLTDVVMPSTEAVALSHGRGIPLRPFEFELVALDEEGRVTQRRRGRSQQFIEDLGDGVTLEMIQKARG